MISNIGVIVGIVFLGVELSQNNRLIERQGRLAGVELSQSVANTLIDNPDARRAFMNQVSGKNVDDPEAQFLVALLRGKMVDIAEWQFTEGTKSRDSLRRSIVEQPATFSGGFWLSNSLGRDPEFVRFVNEQYERSD